MWVSKHQLSEQRLRCTYVGEFSFISTDDYSNVIYVRAKERRLTRGRTYQFQISMTR